MYAVKNVGLIAALLITTNAFAIELEGQGSCQGAFALWTYFYASTDIDCNDEAYVNPCDTVAYQIIGNRTTSAYTNLYNNCINAYYEMGDNDVYEYCYMANDGDYTHDDWYNALDQLGYESMCMNGGYEIPFHLRFGYDVYPSEDDIVYSAEEEFWYSGDPTKIRCYNDDNHNGNEDAMYLVTCDCDDRMEDLSSWYEPCPINIADEHGSLNVSLFNTCYLGNNGAGTTYLCAPYNEVISEDSCSYHCYCEGSADDVIADDNWISSGNSAGALRRSQTEFINLLDRGEESRLGSYGYGCSIDESTEWACSSGYYYQGTNSCGICPDHEESGSLQTSYYANKTGITGCYVPAGEYGSDETGDYEFTEDCHYTP